MEVCVESLASAVAAVQGGASRLELCSALSEGGLTPSLGLFKMVKQAVSIPVFVMLRPRPGNFTYSLEEVEAIQIDAESLLNAGADGVVFGALTADGCVDVETCKKIINSLPQGTPTTFHRAFDWTHDPSGALEDIIKLGFHRILTSGHAATAEEGIHLLQLLINQAGSRITIMPGCGVDGKNLQRILEKTGAFEFHASARQSQAVLVHHNPACSMGTQDLNVKTTNVSLVAEMVHIYREVAKK
ncbi:copper homeostasis protein cutC homolog [Neocloeon triangulifer]|uniref:copper homeostasis protein cutC homolog n=1 Tax=Neocloeon triangulifer TaxID=2078957 RepID=UPI00286FACA3|nr:copper homeostasis protein cutC homolog [Neocloeon triangulifer]